MCGCYDVADCVCFLTFFITALVALLSVQYLVVFLDSISANAQGKPSYLLLLASFYFWLMTLLGCMVFAGIQRRSVRLLKWPGRLLVFLLISGLIAVTAFLWIVNRSHQTGVHDLEGKTIKLFVMLCVVIVYFVAIHKLIITFQSPLIRAHSSPTLQDDDSDHLTQPAIIADFIKNRGKSRQTNKFDKSSDSFSRPFNVASDGINYYVVLLESPYKTGAKRGGGESRIVATTRKAVSRHARYSKSDNADAEDADDEGSCNSITEV